MHFEFNTRQPAALQYYCPLPNDHVMLSNFTYVSFGTDTGGGPAAFTPLGLWHCDQLLRQHPVPHGKLSSVCSSLRQLTWQPAVSYSFKVCMSVPLLSKVEVSKRLHHGDREIFLKTRAGKDVLQAELADLIYSGPIERGCSAESRLDNPWRLSQLWKTYSSTRC